MNAVICCINSKYIHSSLAPWCLLAGVKAYCDKDINAKVIEGTINETPEVIIQRILEEKPEVISFCTYIWNIKTVTYIISQIKAQQPKVEIILGGPEVSYNQHELLTDNKHIDYIVAGEGEKSFAELLKAIKDKIEPENIDGVSFRKANQIIVSEPCILNDDPVSPYCDEYFNTLKGRIAYIETSRGCPYSCAFCLSGRCGNVRFFDLEKSKVNILMLAKSGTKTVKFVDRTFNANKSRAKDIFKFIITNYGNEIPDDVCFHFEIAGDILDNETIGILNSAPKGSIQLEIGLQSFNEKTLAYINRKTNTVKLKENIKRLIEPRNIHIHIDLIAGLPYETFVGFKDSFNIAYNLQPDMLQLGFLKLLHGADMREKSERYPCEFSNEPPYEVISTPWISLEELNILNGVEDAVERLYNSHRFSRTLKYVHDSIEINPFDFFMNFALYTKNSINNRLTLDEYSFMFYKYLLTFINIDSVKLRDLLVCDRLSTNSSGAIPNFLKVKDINLKKYRNALNNLVNKNENRKRGIAILYSENKLVYTDYLQKDRVTGEYLLNYVSFDTLLPLI